MATATPEPLGESSEFTNGLLKYLICVAGVRGKVRLVRQSIEHEFYDLGNGDFDTPAPGTLLRTTYHVDGSDDLVQEIALAAVEYRRKHYGKPPSSSSVRE